MWAFCKKILLSLCDNFAKNTENETVQGTVEILSFIAQNYKGEDLSKKLTHQFLEFNENVVNDIDLSITLMKNNIISIGEWDS